MTYKKILDLCFDKPPKNTFDIVQNLRKNYKCHTINIDDKAYLTLVERSKGYFEICWVVIYPKLQNKGIGSELLGLMFKKYKGVFITKTNNARKFYLDNGFQEIYFDSNRSILIAINNINDIN